MTIFFSEDIIKLLKNMPTNILIIDRNKNVVYINQQFFDFFRSQNIRRDEIKSLILEKFVNSYLDEFDNLIKTGHPQLNIIRKIYFEKINKEYWVKISRIRLVFKKIGNYLYYIDSINDELRKIIQNQIDLKKKDGNKDNGLSEIINIEQRFSKINKDKAINKEDKKVNKEDNEEVAEAEYRFYIMVTIKNFTHQVKDIEGRVTSEYKYKSLFNLSPFPLVLLNRKLEIENYNDKLKQFLGITGENLNKKSIMEIFDIPREFFNDLFKHLSDNLFESYEIRRKNFKLIIKNPELLNRQNHNSSKVIDIYASIFNVHINDPLIQLIFVDKTDEYQAQQNKKIAEESLKLQRDLGVELTSIENVSDILKILFKITRKYTKINKGAIFLYNTIDTEDMKISKISEIEGDDQHLDRVGLPNLTAYYNIKPEFIEPLKYYFKRLPINTMNLSYYSLVLDNKNVQLLEIIKEKLSTIRHDIIKYTTHSHNYQKELFNFILKNKFLIIPIKRGFKILGFFVAICDKDALLNENTKRVLINSCLLLGDVIKRIRLQNEKKRIELELQRINKLESLSLLTGGIAHDFNNYLAKLLGSINIAELNLDNKNELKLALSESKETIREARQLTRQLITFSKGGYPQKQLLRPNELKKLIEKQLKIILKNTKIKTNLKFGENLKSIECDINQCSQVLHNLIMNAEQAMPHGGILNITVENYTIPKQDKAENEYDLTEFVPPENTAFELEGATKGIIDNDPYNSPQDMPPTTPSLPPLKEQFSAILPKPNLNNEAEKTGEFGGFIDNETFEDDLPQYIKHTEIGKLKKTIPLAGDYLKITISDTGKGIPKEIINKIFDPYFTTRREGSGLGLAIIYSIIKKHDGFIEVHSEENKGTTFTLLFPAINDESVSLTANNNIRHSASKPNIMSHANNNQNHIIPNNIPSKNLPGEKINITSANITNIMNNNLNNNLNTQNNNKNSKEKNKNISPKSSKKRAEKNQNNPNKYRILIMDDEKKIRFILVKLLKKKGFMVVEANDGKEAIEKYRESLTDNNKKIDVIIMDLTVSHGLNGVEATKEIMKIDPHAKIIASSGYFDNTLKLNYNQIGFKGYLQKPFNIDELVQKINEIING
ncbi:MAG: ATP-binding protein [Promethearchaeota archaeon]